MTKRYIKVILLILSIYLLNSCVKDISLEVNTNTNVNNALPFLLVINKNTNINKFSTMTPERLQDAMFKDPNMYFTYLITPGKQKTIILDSLGDSFSVFFLEQESGGDISIWDFLLHKPFDSKYVFNLTGNEINIVK